jgi:hypothetical protein
VRVFAGTGVDTYIQLRSDDVQLPVFRACLSGTASAAVPASLIEPAASAVIDAPAPSSGGTPQTAVQVLSSWRVPPHHVAGSAGAATDSHSGAASGAGTASVSTPAAVAAALVASLCRQLNEFLASSDGRDHVSLASKLRVIPSPEACASDVVVVVYVGEGSALVQDLDHHIMRPVMMSLQEEQEHDASRMYASALHGALFDSNEPLARRLVEILPAFFEECVRAADMDERDVSSPRHIANVVYRLAELPELRRFDPLSPDWRDGKKKIPHTLSDGRHVIAVSVDKQRVHVSASVDPRDPSAIELELVTLTSDDDSAVVNSVVDFLGRSGCPMSTGGDVQWLTAPAIRDNSSDGLRFENINGNSQDFYWKRRVGTLDYRIRGWLDAAKLFQSELIASYVTDDIQSWDTSALVGAVERNAWVLRVLGGGDVEAAAAKLAAVRRARNEQAHSARMTKKEFETHMDAVIAVVKMCGR